MWIHIFLAKTILKQPKLSLPSSKIFQLGIGKAHWKMKMHKALDIGSVIKLFHICHRVNDYQSVDSWISTKGLVEILLFSCILVCSNSRTRNSVFALFWPFNIYINSPFLEFFMVLLRFSTNDSKIETFIFFPFFIWCFEFFCFKRRVLSYLK